ncbi:MAG TPA: PucR family transcriptional regulator ligand-binding domain-containing protein [Thermoleophilaceae bacterium]|nr:PucR family transcriptional regulator ligand-binding domain-containing protein [Thermoleophilaceae bacterium]
MLTVRDLVDELGLELLSGGDAAEAPVRWVHISELPDPTPWLSGGEMILTTGLQLTTAKRQRQFARLLCDHHLAGVGFGTGFTHEHVPEALLDEARAVGLPVFEIPYELPFIAITEKAFGRLVNEQYEVLQRGIAIHKRLERLVLEERGLDELVGAVSAAIGGIVMVLDARGETLAAKTFRRELGDAAVEALRASVREQGGNRVARDFVPEHPEIAGRSLALPVSTRGRGAPQAWLVASRDAGNLGDFERLILQQAATVVALELMRQRVMRDTERRLAGDVLAQALTGRLAESEIESRLRPFGVGEQAAVLVFATDDPGAAEPDLEAALADADVGALVACRERLLCAVVDAGGRELDPVDLARSMRAALLAGHGGDHVRAAASRVASVGLVRRSFHEARCALEATGFANGAAPDVASHEDLGAFRLLLAVQDDDALRVYTESVLGPLEDGGGEYGDELLRSLEAFIEQNGQWEKAARQLYCHRHTLRYRIKRIEDLTGRDLKSARDRIELWLALRARELIA